MCLHHEPQSGTGNSFTSCQEQRETSEQHFVGRGQAGAWEDVLMLPPQRKGHSFQ